MEYGTIQLLLQPGFRVRYVGCFMFYGTVDSVKVRRSCSQIEALAYILTAKPSPPTSPLWGIYATEEGL